jgi:hypothetical protein
VLSRESCLVTIGGAKILLDYLLEASFLMCVLRGWCLEEFYEVLGEFMIED